VLNGVVRRWTIREWNEVLVDTSRETTKFSYACVPSRDIQRLARFYTDVLRAEPRWNGPYAEFPSDRGIFCLWAVDAYAQIAGPEAIPKAGAGSVMLESEVADVDAEFTRLRGLSEWAIEFILTPTTMAWGNRSIYFRDPERNLLNLFSRVGRAILLHPQCAPGRSHSGVVVQNQRRER
jgi:catechol 2,3-dioxygenase-like lactoylglutathione lyase family enzyme